MTETVPMGVKDLEEFAASRPRWRMYDQRGVYAGRMFEYPRGQRALLSVSHVSRSHFAAQVNVPFAAGPEDSIEGKLDDCVEWVARTERLLEVPLMLAKRPGATQEHELIGSVKLGGLRLLCMVLEVGFRGSEDDVRQRIVQAVTGA